jgi:hypothetical protein
LTLLFLANNAEEEARLFTMLERSDKMSEPKEVVKVMAAIAGAGYSLQTTIVPENSGDPGSGGGIEGEGPAEKPPPPPPPDGGEGISAPSSGDSDETESTPPPPNQ